MHEICSNMNVTNSDSIFQQKAIQLSNCSNSIVQLMTKTITHNGNTKSSSHQIKETKLAIVRTTLPVILNVMAEEGACLFVNATAAAHKKKPNIRLWLLSHL